LMRILERDSWTYFDKQCIRIYCGVMKLDDPSLALRIILNIRTLVTEDVEALEDDIDQNETEDYTEETCDLQKKLQRYITAIVRSKFFTIEQILYLLEVIDIFGPAPDYDEHAEDNSIINVGRLI